MDTHPTIRGLYAVTPHIAANAVLFAMCRAAINGGAKTLQYRDKESTAKVKHYRAAMLAELCKPHTLFIINDDIHLAKKIKAGGVHLGESDSSIAEARQIGGDNFMIGATCKNDPDKAIVAATAGADYCAMGAVFASPTKPTAPHCPHEKIALAQKSGLPIVAIGGITPTNAHEIFAAGADAVAVCSGIFAADDITQAARQIVLAQNCQDNID